MREPPTCQMASNSRIAVRAETSHACFSAAGTDDGQCRRDLPTQVESAQAIADFEQKDEKRAHTSKEVVLRFAGNGMLIRLMVTDHELIA